MKTNMYLLTAMAAGVKWLLAIKDILQGCNHNEDQVTPKFSDTLTLSQPRGAVSAHHWRGCTIFSQWLRPCRACFGYSAKI